MGRQRGFTLLEIMVALMIFATAAVALSKRLVNNLREFNLFFGSSRLEVTASAF